MTHLLLVMNGPRNYLTCGQPVEKTHARLSGRCFWAGSILPPCYNIKLDDLSHQFAPSVEDSWEETVLPPSCLVVATRWGIKQAVWTAQPGQVTATGCPQNRMYVPPIVRVLLLQLLPVPVPKLPSTFETARLLIIPVFCLQGIPQDVSDHGLYLSCLEGLHPSVSLVVQTNGWTE